MHACRSTLEDPTPGPRTLVGTGLELRGELAEGALPGVLRTLYVGRRTGLLHATRSGERASICFIGGNLVYGDTTLKEAHMGETLVRHGLLTEWDLARASDMIAVTGRRLGQILVDLGLLDADGLDEAVALHVREVLLTIFSWRDGAYAFEDREPWSFRGYDKPLKLSTGEVILDAVWSIADPDIIRYALGDLDRALTPSTDPLLRFQRIQLSAVDGFLLSRVDGVLTAREVLALSPAPVEESERGLLGLLYTGMLEYLPPRPKGPALSRREQVLSAHAAMAGQNHYEFLGLEPGASPSEALAAYFRLARVYHPDGHHETGLEALKDRMEALFAHLTEAHRVLSNPALRDQYDASLRSPAPPIAAAPSEAPPPPPHPGRVSELLDAADRALAGRQALEAARLASEALAGAKGRDRRRARVLRVNGLIAGAGDRKAAEEELHIALKEDPGNAEAHFLLGSIYKEGGAATLAAASFRRALALRPRHAGALGELAGLEATAPAPRPGVFTKLFRHREGE